MRKFGKYIAFNVLQLGEVADFEALTFILALMFIWKPNVQFSTEPAILPNCCCKKPFIIRIFFFAHLFLYFYLSLLYISG